MFLRPVDPSGDILPVLKLSDLLSGGAAASRLLRDRLSLLSGDWWESPSLGNRCFDMIREGRLSESDRQALCTYLTGYIAQTTGISSVEEATCEASGRSLSVHVRAAAGEEQIDLSYEVNP